MKIQLRIKKNLATEFNFYILKLSCKVITWIMPSFWKWLLFQMETLKTYPKFVGSTNDINHLLTQHHMSCSTLQLPSNVTGQRRTSPHLRNGDRTSHKQLRYHSTWVMTRSRLSPSPRTFLLKPTLRTVSGLSISRIAPGCLSSTWFYISAIIHNYCK